MAALGELHAQFSKNQIPYVHYYYYYIEKLCYNNKILFKYDLFACFENCL